MTSTGTLGSSSQAWGLQEGAGLDRLMLYEHLASGSQERWETDTRMWTVIYGTAIDAGLENSKIFVNNGCRRAEV